MKDSKNGITLIALVITIIVLLILAGISISLVTGQNGVLTRAEDASNTYSMSSAKEQANMRAAGYVSEYTEKVYVDNDSTVGAMTAGEYVLSQINGEEDGDYRYSVSGSTITVTSKTTGEALASGTVRDDGGIAWSDSVASGGSSSNTNNINTNTNTNTQGNNNTNNNENTNTGNNNTQNTLSGVTASAVATAPNTYYGKTVKYTGDTSGYTGGWKIFYSDGSSIFLIATDYVPNVNLPINACGAVSYETYGFYWDSVPTSAQSPRLAAKSWNRWTDYSSYDNSKCISTLLRTSNWDSFKNSYAEYAIGGPTLKMFCESWNGMGYTTLSCENSDEYGYYMGIDDYYSEVSAESGYEDSLYFPHTSYISNCTGYWLASPCALDGSGLMSVYYLGALNGQSFDSYSLGIRPVVCLQSGVTLTEGTDGYDFNLSL